MPGVLFVVATPIGNLEDLTFRALRTLREVDLIAAEDTRRTARLLAHYEIKRPLVSVREHNEARQTARLIADLRAGRQIALVSDAGTPGISDPGAHVVAAARHAGVRVVPIPGPSAVATALSASGFPADQFSFMGFPPSSGTAREAWMEAIRSEFRIVVLFEAPHRIERTLSDLTNILGTRQIIVARELTKTHEEFVERPNTAATAIREQGEFTVVVGPAEATTSANDLDGRVLADLFGRLTELAAVEPEVALGMVAASVRASTKEVRKLIKKGRILVKQQSSQAD